jgi:hypothetical protein
MRPPAISGAPSLIVDAGSGAKLRAGVPISVTVLENPAPGLYRILVEGQSLRARSGLALSPGSVLLARVLPAPAGGGILLKLEAGKPPAPGFPPGVDSLLARLGLPVDAAGRLAASALLAEGLAPNPASLNRVKRTVLGHAGAEGSDALDEAARLAARLEAKGLAASPEAVGALAAAGDGRSGWSGRRDGGQGGGGSQAGGRQGEGMPKGQEGQDGQEAVAGLPPPTASDLRGRTGAAPALTGLIAGLGQVAEASLPAEADGMAKELGAFLRRLVFSASGTSEGASGLKGATGLEGAAGGVGPAPADGQALLGLFNHARPEGQGWIILPFRFALDSVAFAGSFRILLPYMPGGPGRLEARFDASAGGFEGLEAEGPARKARAWGFDLSFGSGRPCLVIHGSGDLPGLPAMVADLAAELGEAACDTRLAGPEGVSMRGGAELDAWA